MKNAKQTTDMHENANEIKLKEMSHLFSYLHRPVFDDLEGLA